VSGESGRGPAAASGNDPLVTLTLRPRVIEALCSVFDPEIPVNIYELGLVYGVEVDAGGHVSIRMTLTSPACPAVQHLPGQVQAMVEAVEGVSGATVDVVWEPPWSPDRMSDAARLQLGLV
jgi:FeS assembly SUF system protein